MKKVSSLLGGVVVSVVIVPSPYNCQRPKAILYPYLGKILPSNKKMLLWK
ncbi:hypothetical protein [Aequorivita ciconiae]|nr:hypothetical protein [Aequorivita sp. H23M31]